MSELDDYEEEASSRPFNAVSGGGNGPMMPMMPLQLSLGWRRGGSTDELHPSLLQRTGGATTETTLGLVLVGV